MKKADKKRIVLSDLKLFGLIFLIVVPLVYIPSVMDAALMPRLSTFTAAIALFFIFVFYLQKKRPQKVDIRILFNMPVLLLIGYWVVSGLSNFFAINPAVAISEWLLMIPFILFIMLGSFLFSRQEEPIPVITKFVVSFGILHSIIGLAQFINLTFKVGLSHELSYYVTGLSAHRNLYSQILFLSIPFSLYGVYLFKGKWQWLSVISSVLGLGLVTVLLAKSVWMAIAVTLAVTPLTVMNYYSYFKFGKRALRKIMLAFGLFIGIISVFVVIYASLDSWETIRKQTDWIRNYRFGSALERVDLWEKSVEMYRDNPITGVGTGNWKIVLPAYGTDGLRSSEGTVNFVRPHNDYLWVLTENGIFAFLLYIGFFVSLIIYLYRLMKSEIDKKEKGLLLALFSGLFGYMIIALLSFPKERVEHNIFLGIYAICIISLYRKHFALRERAIGNLNPIAKAAIPAILVLPLIVGLSKTISEYHTKIALDYRSENLHAEVINEIDKAENFFYQIDNTSMPLAWYKGSAHFQLGQIDTSFEEYLRAYQYNPNNMHVLNNLATCYELKGDHKNAIELYNRALKVSSSFKDAWLNLVAVYYSQGDWDQALEALNHVDPMNENPKYLKSRRLVLMKQLELIQQNLNDSEIVQAVHRIAIADDWVQKVYEQSLAEGVPFDFRVLNEAIYLMEVVDGSIDEEKAIELKDEYLKSK
ncbi:MAG: O-antigen ligase family protein [Bacteroidales bacterium]|nr:O-antigen ligase family protein [Bacteroidales bacterium]MCF8455663.1 O-antigen ligase family protein [Bacteroidales bacterium]